MNDETYVKRKEHMLHVKKNKKKKKENKKGISDSGNPNI